MKNMIRRRKRQKEEKEEERREDEGTFKENEERKYGRLVPTICHWLLSPSR
jgi:hypothetical protein